MSNPRVVLITGAHTGLGIEIVKALMDSDKTYKILMAGRTPSKTSTAIDDLKKSYPKSSSSLHSITLDVESDESIASAASTIEKEHDGHIDVLINNAGASFEQGIAESGLTLRQAFNKDWDVNVTGSHLLTRALLPYLLKSSKPYLMFMTSGTSSLHESESEDLWFNKAGPAGLPKPVGFTGYRSCKAGLNLVMREWHRLLLNDGVYVWSVSPGWLATGLGGVGPEKLKAMGAGDPELGGKFLRDVVEGKREADRGKVIKSGGLQPY